MKQRVDLIDLIRQRALKFGEFTLASGKKASYYLDGKQITLHSEGLRAVSEGLLELLEGVKGPVQPGMKVVIVDDVVTTGGSSLLAIDRIQEFGCEVVQVVAIVDRMEGGAANFAASGVDTSCQIVSCTE